MGWSDDDDDDDNDETPSWVKEQSPHGKAAPPRGDSSSLGSSSPSVDGGDGGDEPAATQAAEDSDVWSQSDEPAKDADEDAEEEEEEEGAEAAASQDAPAKQKPKGKAPPASRLPFVLAPKVKRDILLFESTDSALDLSGDFGCIGRLRVHTKGGSSGASSSANGSAAAPLHGDHAITLDLKGKVFDGDVVPCNTLCIVSIDDKQAKVETVFSDFVRLGPARTSIFDMETIAEGEMGADFFDEQDDGFVDGSDDDEELGPLKEKGRGKPSKAKRQSSSGSAKGKGKAKPKGDSGSKPKRPAPAAKAPAAKKAKA